MNIPFIVAIGSSAGGMTPMQTFFEATPHDAITYVILRHFLLQERSMLQEILQGHSKLKVVEITDHTLIEKDKVYICPPAMYVTLNPKGFQLIPRDAAKPYPNKTFDKFLNALAWLKGSHTIAVVLSGNGSDGSEGIAAIHKAGGLVVAQEPDSCQFFSMPASAIKTGFVDHVMLPEDMPATIAEYVDREIFQR